MMFFVHNKHPILHLILLPFMILILRSRLISEMVLIVLQTSTPNVLGVIKSDRTMVRSINEKNKMENKGWFKGN